MTSSPLDNLVRIGKLKIEPLAQTEIDAIDAATRLRATGVEHVIFTDIRRDGTLTGPNLDVLTTMVETALAFSRTCGR